MGFSHLPSQLYSEREFKCHYENPLALSLLSDQLSKFLVEIDPQGRREIAVVCIGTDRATGDCLGPLVGWILKRHPINFALYGTLDDPVHATNLSEKLETIKATHHSPLIIAVDACLGRLQNVGMINIGLGEISPGAGVHKKLPPVGDIYFTGIVNVSGHMEFLVLQNTRLNIVMQMATKIAYSIIIGIKKAKRG
ncbi:MAG: spore protease YyaC [Bacillota bacterium]|jgi:putative sporulation protein YyaC|nr:spore protease YyaC [Clostridia bacterium]